MTCWVFARSLQLPWLLPNLRNMPSFARARTGCSRQPVLLAVELNWQDRWDVPAVCLPWTSPDHSGLTRQYPVVRLPERRPGHGLRLSSLQVLVATFSRSFKEAQTYLSMMVLLPLAPGFLMTVKPVEEQAWMMGVPALGQQLMMGTVLQGGGLPAVDFGLSVLAGVLVTAGCVVACGELLKRESIVFGR